MIALQGREVPGSYWTHIHTHHTHSHPHIHTHVLHTCTHPNSHPTYTHHSHSPHTSLTHTAPQTHTPLTFSCTTHTHTMYTYTPTHIPDTCNIHTIPTHTALTHNTHIPPTQNIQIHILTTHTLSHTHTTHTHLVKLGSSAAHQELRAVTCLPWLRDPPLCHCSVSFMASLPVCPDLSFSLYVRHRTQKPEWTGLRGEDCGERELTLSPKGWSPPSCSGTVGLGLRDSLVFKRGIGSLCEIAQF